MVREEPAQLPFADPETAGEGGDVAVVERPVFDEAERARDGRGGSHPARRAGGRLRTATQAGPEARRLGRGCATEEDDVLAQGGPRRADGPAIDPGGPDPDEEAAVEPGVAGSQSAVADVFVEQRHDRHPTPFAASYWRFSDADGGRFRRIESTNPPVSAADRSAISSIGTCPTPW